MANITELIKKIRSAILGKDVRESIAGAIEQCYEDASKNGNANMEVSEARGEFDTLKKRLDSSDNNIEKKRNINSNITMADLSQEVKQAMTGGSVAVVGNNAVKNLNISSNANNVRTTEFVKTISQNLFNGKLYQGYVDENGNLHSSEAYYHTDYIPVTNQRYISFLLRERRSTNDVPYNLYYSKLYNGIRFIAWYDNNFNAITGNGYDNEGYAKNESVQAIDENVAYCVITVSSTLFSNKINCERIMIISTENELKVDDEIPYNCYKNNLDNTFFINDTEKNEINNLIDLKLANLILKDNDNVFNPIANKVGYVRNTGISINDSYRYTPKIPIKSGEFISFRSKNSNDEFSSLIPIRIITFYDLNNNCVQEYDNEELMPEVVQAVSQDIEYCIVSVNKTYNNFNCMLQITDTNTSNQQIRFLPYSTKIAIPSIYESTLYKKILVNFGDSIASGANGISYAQQIANNNLMEYHSYAFGGATLADNNSDERTSILAQVNDFISNDTIPDFILINGGTNDILYNQLGELSNFYSETSSNIWDTTTSAGALEKIFYLLKSNKPITKILYVIPHKMQTRDIDLQNQWFTLIKQICQKWSVPIASIFDDGTLNTNVESMRIYTDSGTHPTTEGYTKFYVPIIEKKLKSL